MNVSVKPATKGIPDTYDIIIVTPRHVETVTLLVVLIGEEWAEV